MQVAPVGRGLMKINEKAFSDWLESRPESENIEDRRPKFTQSDLDILRSFGAPDKVLKRLEKMEKQ